MGKEALCLYLDVLVWGKHLYCLTICQVSEGQSSSGSEKNKHRKKTEKLVHSRIRWLM